MARGLPGSVQKIVAQQEESSQSKKVIFDVLTLR